jgi:hypothetical protein
MEFDVLIDKWCTETEEKLETVAKETVIEVAKRVIFRTPYGQPEFWQHKPPPGYVPGTARAGWHASVGAPVVSLPTRPDAGGTATLAALVADLPAQVGGKVIYISNNVPHIIPLERGHSFRQAPFGMARLTALEFGAITRQKILEVVH